MSSLMSPKIQIRRAKSRETVEKLLRLFDDDYETPFSTFTPDLSGYAEKIFRYGEVYFATVDEVPVGMCSFYANDQSEAKVAYLTGIVASRKTRGRGVGKALLNTFLEISILRGMKIAKLQVYGANQNAVSFYTKSGFQREKDLDAKSFYMIKTLNEGLYRVNII